MNIVKSIIGGLIGGMLSLSAGIAVAEDIDLFLGLPASSTDAPNVLFVIDNTANWAQTSSVTGNAIWDSEQTALADIFDSLDDGIINIGILMYTETGGDDDNVDGGYIRAAIRNMSGTTTDKYIDLIESFDILDDRSNGGKAGLAMMEAYLYFAGLGPQSGNNKVKTDYLTNNNGTTEDNAVWTLPGNALNSKGGSPYNSPIADGYCGKNYIIFISNGAAQDNNADISRGEGILSSLGGDISQISITPSGSAKNPADEWARFMANSPEDITTFTIDVDKVTTGQGPGWSALLQSMADESGGTYCDATSGISDITECVNAALSKILAVNSVFASVALPASSNAQSTFVNQVYIGQFRPDENGNPRWFGNLKQYKLGFDSGSGSNVLRLLDANDDVAIDSGTGFVDECARSFWTPGGTDSYWSYLAPGDRRGECLLVPSSDQSNYPDGPVVEKGGQAYVGRGGLNWATASVSRTVKTTPSSFCGGDTGGPCTTADLTNFDTNNGSVTAVLTNDQINWARGEDIQNEDNDSDGNTGDYRPSLHLDVVHSQPIAVDYANNPADPNVVVFYGANDGMLRAINGNRSASSSFTSAGEEYWAFMPPEFYPHVDRLYDNTTVINFPASGATAGTGGAAKPYGPDGPITAWKDVSNHRYLYSAMRRGGRTIYGFDITTIGSPTLLFRLGCTTPIGDDSGCASGWDEVGQTWSPMQVAEHESGNTYLIMGGGYDPCEDEDDPNTPANHDCSAGTEGDRVYVLHATTGAIANSFQTDRAVPGAVTVVTVSDSDPNIQFAYAADTGGNIYRLSGPAGAAIGTTLPASWELTKIADLGCGDKSDDTCSANRKFLYGPDVIRMPTSGRFGVFVGSGDREKPIYDYGAARSVSNYFYALFDDPNDPTWLTSESATCNESSICADSLTSVDPNTPLATGMTVSDKGWKMALRDDEQVVSAALTVADVINFSTHIPEDPNSLQCDSDLGTATTYNVDYTDGEGDLINIVGGGLVPTPVAGNVILDDGTTVPFCIGCGGENSAIGGSEVTSGINWTQGKSRVYWKIDK
ncbi:pilus assembly protein PilY [Seongchinamella unica]|uniref:Pilus assembly protein PilY n=1 Tax=Seongchinamella unica TaxID=2547392 RepID=A0A4R5LPA9_9GAMM|nr:PilC/PilY family type IV pilus protein [Seongchinamella unica]TDG12364.1 pilus assembly protein PilY [Seongchinamella unica]